MSFLRKIFKWNQQEQPERTERYLGRYSDNNKSVAKTRHWEDAETYFKDGKYIESVEAFFRYLRDETVNNVTFTRDGNAFRFEIFQGSKVIRGTGNEKRLQAKVVLALMPEPSVPVMRRLLEQNFQLFYSRYSLKGDRLYMQMESDMDSANPNKMYYALKELAVVSDRQDDLLLQDFHSIRKIDSDHISPMPESEKAVRYKYFRYWLDKALEATKQMDQEKHAGGISFMLLAALFRIDFLITPEGRLRNDIEKAQAAYYKKDGASQVDKNRDLLKAINKMKAYTQEEMYSFLFNSVSTFAIRQPKPHASVIEAIQNAANSAEWYLENQFPQTALEILEYGLSYPQYAYSLPRPLTEMFQVMMEMNHPDYFREIGYAYTLYDNATRQFRIAETERILMNIVRRWKGKYPGLVFPREKLSFQSLYAFNRSFSEMIASINFDNKL